MSRVFVLLLDGVVEWVIAKTLLDSLYTDKIKNKSKYGFANGLIIYIIVAAIQLIFDNAFVYIPLFLVANMIWLFLEYKIEYYKIIGFSLSLTFLMVISETAFFSSLFFETLESLNNLMSMDFQTLASGKLLYFCLSRIFRFCIQKLRKEKSKNFQYVLIIAPLLILVVICINVTKIYVSGNIDHTVIKNIFSVVFPIVMVIAITASVLHERRKKDIDEIPIEFVREAQEGTSAEYLKVLQKQNEELAKKVHDEKNHLYIIKNLKSKEEIEEYIDGILEEINSQKVAIRTKNPVLDILLHKYAVLCDGQDIKYSFKTQTANLDFMADNDIVSLVDNLLENAVEATSKSEDRVINFSIARNNNFYIVKCFNTFKIDPVQKNGRFISVKNNEYHGFGTEIIESVVKAYNGFSDVTIDKEEKTFDYTIMLPVKI